MSIALTPETAPQVRTASLFRNGRNQALRIPREFELDASQVEIRKEGNSLVITPLRPDRLLALLASWEPLAPEDDFPEMEDLPPQERDVF
jgi:antitoxin VapB